MNKEVILKNGFLIALLGFVFIFSSCRKDEKKIIGKWQYKNFEVKSLSCSDPNNEIGLKLFAKLVIEESLIMDNGFGGVFQFTKKGKVVVYNEFEKVEIATYQTNKNKLTIFDADYNGEEIVSCNYSISNRKMYWDIDILEYLGNQLETLTETEITTFIIRLTFEKK